ncbi:hypothetical protein ACWIGW_44140 [Nocardia brasiliensis]|uniref:hypothetical protein n=1 Tax=Streptomyces sp. NPDC056056 TaxID=3345698 RepID=UPI0035D937CF
MLFGIPVAVFVIYRQVVPADLKDRVLAVVVPVVIGAGAILAAVGVAVVVSAVAKGRGFRWLRYRRRWAKALDTARLTARRGDEFLVPKLVSVTGRGADVVRVQMLDGQAPGAFARRLPGLVKAFGAREGALRLVENRPTEIELVFTKTTAASKARVAKSLIGGA